MLMVVQHCHKSFQLNIRNDSALILQYDTLVYSSIQKIFRQGTGCPTYHTFLAVFCDPGVNLTSNRNEYQSCLVRGKCGWCLRLTT
jgi:hypothetical protein